MIDYLNKLIAEKEKELQDLRFSLMQVKMWGEIRESGTVCPAYKTKCRYYICRYDRNGEVDIEFCNHPKNPADTEGNCNTENCPITIEDSKNDHNTKL